MFTKNTLIKTAKANGFTGTPDQLAQWVKDNKIEFQDVDGKIADVAAIMATKTVTVTADAGEVVKIAGEGESEAEGEMPGEMAKSLDDDAVADYKRLKAKETAELRAKNGTGAIVAKGAAPERFNIGNARSKMYNQKAKRGRGENDRRTEIETSFSSADEAEAFGEWVKSDILGIRTKASHVTASNSLGGALVPEQFLPTLIDLKEVYGVARKLVPFVQIDGHQVKLPRSVGDLTVYSPAEGGDTTESNLTFDNVEVTTKEMAVLATASKALIRESAIDIGDIVARKIAWAFAAKEDECFFLGDGTSTYYGITGLAQAFRNSVEQAGGTWVTNNANQAGIVTAAGNLWSEFVLTDYETVVGLLPEYAELGPVKWVTSKPHWANAMVRLAYAAGGNAVTDIERGVNKRFMDYEVQTAQKMPRTDSNSQIAAYLGNFAEGVKAAETRGSMEIAVSTERYFEKGLIGFRGTQQVGINVHDVGNYTATAADRQPGPIVALISAAS